VLSAPKLIFFFGRGESLWTDTNHSPAVWPSLARHLARHWQQKPSKQAASTFSTFSSTYSAYALSTVRGLKKNKSLLTQQLSVYLKSGDKQRTGLIMKERLIEVEKVCAE